jgi:hypothetical protein
VFTDSPKKEPLNIPLGLPPQITNKQLLRDEWVVPIVKHDSVNNNINTRS